MMKRMFFVQWGPNANHLIHTKEFEKKYEAIAFTDTLTYPSLYYRVTSQDFKEWTPGENERLIVEGYKQ